MDKASASGAEDSGFESLLRQDKRLDMPSTFFRQGEEGSTVGCVLSALLDGEISILVAFATKIVKQHP